MSGAVSTQAPVVSVICAAYNRADVLRFAIESVCASTFQSWEMIVIGDGATDHSEAVVAGFGDERISFENLAANTGGQAAPNSRGMVKARGRYVMFLNQDDMITHDHIARAVAHLEATGADLTWRPVVVTIASGRDEGPPDSRVDQLVLEGVVEPAHFDPDVFNIASCWLLRREACERLGAWPSERDQRVTPSQAWMHRAAQLGLNMVFTPEPTVFCIHAGRRALSYKHTVAREHARVWSWINNPDWLREAFVCAAISQSKTLYTFARATAAQADKQIRELSGAFGLHPVELRRFLHKMAPGGYIDYLRRFTHDAPALGEDQLIAAGEAENAGFLADGWLPGEGAMVWSTQTSAELAFVTTATAHPRTLRMKVHTFRPNTLLEIVVAGKTVAHCILDGETLIDAPLGVTDGLTIVTLRVDGCASLRELGLAQADTRTLGVALHSFVLVTAQEPDWPAAAP